MSTTALREGFQELWNDPALLLIEIAWRWAFGILAGLACVLAVAFGAKGVQVSSSALGSSSGMDPFTTAQDLASILLQLGGVVLRLGIVAVLFLAISWGVLSTLGRRATLLRPALASGSDLSGCAKISAVRAAITLGALAAWISAGLAAGSMVAFSARNGPPNLLLAIPILLPALIVIVCAWSAANWYLSLAPLFNEERWFQCARKAFSLVASHRDEVLEISLVTASIRLICFVLASGLSLAAGAAITNMRILALDLTVVALLYFAAADAVSMARLAAFAKLRDRQVKVQAETQVAHA